MIEPILTAIMRGTVTANQVLSKRKQLVFSAQRFMQSNSDAANALQIALDYIASKRVLPASVDVLKDFVSIVPGTEELPPAIKERYKKNSEQYRKAIFAVQEFLDAEPNAPGDFDLVCQALLDEARRKLYLSVYGNAQAIVQGSLPATKPGQPALSGINDARRYISERLAALDTCADQGTIQGDFHEHLDHVKHNLLDALVDPTGKRIFTGLPSIDQKLVIGPGEPLRFCLIAGYTNHGKSGLLMTIIYRALQQGKRVLFVPLEFDAMEAWKRLTWLHLQNVKINLPSLTLWKTKPELVTEEHKRNLDVLIDDLKTGKSLPGRIDVVHATTWPEIIEYANSPAVPYDMLAIDYISHLSVEGKDRREGVVRVFNDAQSFSHTYRDNRGITVFSPAQVNKAGLKNASASEEMAEGDYMWGVYGLQDIDTYTDAARNSDVVINVFQAGYLKHRSEVKLSCMKSREAFFEPFVCHVDPRTRFFQETYQVPAGGEKIVCRNESAKDRLQREERERKMAEVEELMLDAL